MTEAEILGRLRYAPEGRAAKVNISGLFWNFVVQSSFNMPILGYFSRLIMVTDAAGSNLRHSPNTVDYSEDETTQLADHLVGLFIICSMMNCKIFLTDIFEREPIGNAVPQTC